MKAVLSPSQKSLFRSTRSQIVTTHFDERWLNFRSNVCLVDITRTKPIIYWIFVIWDKKKSLNKKKDLSGIWKKLGLRRDRSQKILSFNIIKRRRLLEQF